MTRRILNFASVALFGAAMCAAAHSPQAPNHSTSAAGTKHSIPKKVPLAGVSNFGEVTPTLYRGAQPSKRGFDNLAKMGIDIVVDLRGSRAGERDKVTKLGMRYVAIPWHCFHPKDGDFARFLTLLRENPGKKVFVHCNTGDDRTGMEIAAYRMAEQGWTAEDARKEMEAFGFSPFHRMICPGLASYEKEFPRHLKTSPAFQDLRSTRRGPEARP